MGRAEDVSRAARGNDGRPEGARHHMRLDARQDSATGPVHGPEMQRPAPSPQCKTLCHHESRPSLTCPAMENQELAVWLRHESMTPIATLR